MRYLDDDLLSRIEERSRRRLSRRGLFAGSLKLGAGGALALALSGTAVQFASAQDDEGIGSGGRTETGGGGRRGGGGRDQGDGVGGGGTVETAPAAAAPAASGDLPSTGVGPLGGGSHVPELIGAAAIGAAAAAALTYRQANAAESTDA